MQLTHAIHNHVHERQRYSFKTSRGPADVIVTTVTFYIQSIEVPNIPHSTLHNPGTQNNKYASF